MGDPDFSSDQRSENYHRGRGTQHSNRSFYRGRGRGRGRGDDRFYNVQRALNELGVSDLREHLNRKHEQEEARGGPPSDPSYNYLRDPMREDNDQPAKVSTNLQRSNSYKRGRGRPRHQEESFIQNPMNIKVVLSTTTGQRNFSIDEDSTLPDIKCIPDYQYTDYQERFGSSRGRGGRSIRTRGRANFTGQNGRMRAKSSERKYNEELNENWGSHTRSKSVEGRGEDSRSKGENRNRENRGRGDVTGDNRGRGNQRTNRGNYRDSRNRQWDSNKLSDVENSTEKSSREYRGRGKVRGRGRGNRRGRGNQAQQSFTDFNPASFEVASEENWDIEEPTQTVDKYQEYIQHNNDDCRDGDDQNSEDPAKVVMEENLLVTSSLQGDVKRRTVRFSLGDDEEEFKTDRKNDDAEGISDGEVGDDNEESETDGKVDNAEGKSDGKVVENEEIMVKDCGDVEEKVDTNGEEIVKENVCDG